MDNINYRGIPTSIFLNGPKLGIVTDPQNQTDVIGVATFTGIATATFPNPTDGVNDGSIEINWYFDGSKITNDEGTQNNTSNASIVGFSSATGTGSTITINGLTTDDDNKEVYFTAEYIPSAYSQPAGSAVTAGTARSTGNVFNGPLQSGIGTITVSPIIEITSQPEDQIIGKTFDASYSIAAQVSPPPPFNVRPAPIGYQWQLDGVDLSDGTTTQTVSERSSGQIAITNNEELDRIQTIDFSQVSSYDSFVTGRTYTLTPNADITAKVFATGAGGGRSNQRSVSGGAGGSSEGTFTFVKDQAYKLRIGGAGVNNGPGGFSGGGNGGGGHGGGGGGGGFTGLFEESITVGNAVIIAGGGGGGSNDPATGGSGGGTSGGNGSNGPGPRGGGGGTQSSGGSGGSGGGGALQGGPGAAGGGGGYYGGAGGNGFSGCCADGAGGGGSGYIGGVTDGTTFAGAGGAANGGNGSFRIELVSTTKTVTTTISGSQTDNLTITSDDEGAGVIRCKLSADNVQVSPVFSRSVSYYVVGIRNVIKIEQYNYTGGTAILSENNLSDGGLSLSYDSHPGNAICLYAAEQDIDVEMDMYGGAGANSGAEGGYSKIKFTMKRNDEYVLTGLFDAVNAPFLYRKGTLIAVVGASGMRGIAQASVTSEPENIWGGDGGGIGIAGEDGEGQSSGLGGNGGERIVDGTLPSNGIFGSATSITAVTPDTVAIGRDGGRTLPCARGVYWRDQGKSPCEDLGIIKFRTPNGTEISNTAEITRGYKSGYNIIQTKGRGGGDQFFNVLGGALVSGYLQNRGGDGGAGATGGGGGQFGGGGGGGSGYTDGSVTVLSTQQGGSIGLARINIKLSASNFFIDDEGRILIMSCTDFRDPNTLEITTGQILVGDNKVLDDARWQNFLDLARDGSRDYRLTATLNNSTTKITNATTKNIHRMMNANQLTLRTSLARGWVDMTYVSGYSGRKAMAWDETSGATITGTDYSMLWWASGSGWGYYGSSSNSFFTPTNYSQPSANYWILPPGVPDF